MADLDDGASEMHMDMSAADLVMAKGKAELLDELKSIETLALFISIDVVQASHLSQTT